MLMPVCKSPTRLSCCPSHQIFVMKEPVLHPPKNNMDQVYVIIYQMELFKSQHKLLVHLRLHIESGYSATIVPYYSCFQPLDSIHGDNCS